MRSEPASGDLLIDSYDQLVTNALNNGQLLNFTQFQILFSDSYPTISDTTIHKHLTKLVKLDVIEIDERKQPLARSHNEKYYSLTPGTEFQLQFFGSIGVGAQEDKKACISILLRAVSGAEPRKIVDQPVPGAIISYNSSNSRHEILISEKQEGVTSRDIVQHKDMRSLFRHVNFTESQIAKYINQISEENFGLQLHDDPWKALWKVLRDGEVGIWIGHNYPHLKDFLTLCECMISDVAFRMIDTIAIAVFDTLYNKEKQETNRKWRKHLSPSSYLSQRKEAIKWYIDMYDTEHFNSLHHRCEEAFHEKIASVNQKWSYNHSKQIRIGTRAKRQEIRKFIQGRIARIEQWDKSIIAYYRGYIKCDKKVDFPRGSIEYEKYCDYVVDIMHAEMAEKYLTLIDIVMEMVYPMFLRRYHQNSPKLVEFTNSLPDNGRKETGKNK